MTSFRARVARKAPASDTSVGPTTDDHVTATHAGYVGDAAPLSRSLNTGRDMVISVQVSPAMFVVGTGLIRFGRAVFRINDNFCRSRYDRGGISRLREPLPFRRMLRKRYVTS